MDDVVGITLVCNEEYGAQFEDGLFENTVGITIEGIVDPSTVRDGWDPSGTGCVISVDTRHEPPIEPIYEYLRENWQEQPVIVASDEGEDVELISKLVNDEKGDYVFLPEGDIPFGLLSARCKRLTTDEERNSTE